MAQDTAPSKPDQGAKKRDDRLKAALKANMARRKAQARARSAPDKDTPDNDTPGKDTPGQGETGNGPTGQQEDS